MLHHAALLVAPGFDPAPLRRHLRAEGFGIADRSPLVPLPAGAADGPFSMAAMSASIARNDPVDPSGRGVIAMTFEDFDEAGATRLGAALRKLVKSGLLLEWDGIDTASMEAFPLAPAVSAPAPAAVQPGAPASAPPKAGLQDAADLSWKLSCQPFALPLVFTAEGDERHIEIGEGTADLVSPDGERDSLLGQGRVGTTILRGLFSGESGPLEHMIIAHERAIALLGNPWGETALPDRAELSGVSWSVVRNSSAEAVLSTSVEGARVVARLTAGKRGIDLHVVNPNPLSRVPRVALPADPSVNDAALAGVLAQAVARHTWETAPETPFDAAAFLDAQGIAADAPLRDRGVYAVLRQAGSLHALDDLVRRGGWQTGPVSPVLSHPPLRAPSRFHAPSAIANIEALGPYPGPNGVDLVFIEIRTPAGVDAYLDLMASHEVILAWGEVPEEMVSRLDAVVEEEMSRRARNADPVAEVENFPAGH